MSLMVWAYVWQKMPMKSTIFSHQLAKFTKYQRLKNIVVRSFLICVQKQRKNKRGSNTIWLWYLTFFFILFYERPIIENKIGTRIPKRVLLQTFIFLEKNELVRVVDSNQNMVSPRIFTWPIGPTLNRPCRYICLMFPCSLIMPLTISYFHHLIYYVSHAYAHRPMSLTSKNRCQVVF